MLPTTKRTDRNCTPPTHNVENYPQTYIRVKGNVYIGYDAFEFILANESQPRNQTAAAQPRL
jgi:hypothetical protein